MVVHDLHFKGVPLAPLEADPPLVVDSDAVLAGPVPFQRLQAIAGWHPQIEEALGVVQHPQLPSCRFLNLQGQLPHRLAMPDLFGPVALEGPDHG